MSRTQNHLLKYTWIEFHTHQKMEQLSLSVSTSSKSSMVSQNNSGAGDLEITVDVFVAKDLVINSGYRYIDVRTTEEFEKGHVAVEKVVNIPYMFVNPEGSRVKNPEFVEQVSSLFKKEDHIVVGCQSGVRSLYATEDLHGTGFKDVKNMGGGYLAWVENALAVKKH
ncbi:hypothetical protein QQ045_026573 [Rhodiola kirilowii]